MTYKHLVCKPETHKQIRIAAAQSGLSIFDVTEQAVQLYLESLTVAR